MLFWGGQDRCGVCLSRSEQTDVVGGKGDRGYECRLIGGVDLYACHDEVIDIHSGKEGYMGSTPGNIVVFNSDTGGTCLGLPIFQGSVVFTWDIMAFPFGQDLSRLYSVISVGICGSFGHDSPVTW